MQVCSDDSHYQRGSSELDLCTFTLVHLFVNFEFNLKHLSVNYSPSPRTYLERSQRVNRGNGNKL